jgi:hypothetical protein
MTDSTPAELDATTETPAPIPTGRGGKTPPAIITPQPAPEPTPDPAPVTDPDDEQELATLEAFAYVPDPRPAALVAAANYYAGANVPDDVLIAKARKFERYLLEPRDDDWNPLSSSKARKAAKEAKA